MNRRTFPVALVSLIAAFASETELRAQGGLDQAVPVAPFLNGRLPSSLSGPSSGNWTFTEAFPLLRFIDPVQILPVPFSSRLLVVEKPGRIVVFEDDPGTAASRTLLDFSDQVSSLEDSGLLGAVFHPDFGRESSPNRHDLFLYYRYTPDTSDKDRAYLRLSRFTWDPTADTIDPESEFILIQQYDRNNWHNGGGLAFGPEGFLYLTLGDEGGIYDNLGSAQQINRGFFSGVIRIDVTGIPGRSHPIRRQPLDPAVPPTGWPSSFSRGYWIPDDNPWQSPEGELLEEFWAIGLRSPYRMTLDPASGQFWIGDVGQYSREEINLLSRGANYQWPFLEGDRPTPNPRPQDLIGTEMPPLYQYPREEGGCIIGGFVYRGRLHPDLAGAYLYADWNLGAVRALVRDEESHWLSKHLVTLPRHGTPPRNGISGFGTNGDGEIFLLSLAGTNLAGGRIYRLARESSTGQDPPALLSETGAFADLETLEVAPGLIPYEPIQSLWSDGAEKRRWIAIPNDGTPNTPSERITYSQSNEWIFPVGTVLVKHFELEAKRLETRFLVRGSDGEWFGFTYRWNEDQLDAVLLPGEVPVVSIESIGGESVEWRFPSR
ncbi:MAG: PQQ-dependent sugar dehydrogenase, partial [Verrucomicrobiae bacterium]|nr:PQQ-dependent sugar dehydrogenase [Verrucomicrobiae bacterium]